MTPREITSQRSARRDLIDMAGKGRKRILDCRSCHRLPAASYQQILGGLGGVRGPPTHGSTTQAASCRQPTAGNASALPCQVAVFELGLEVVAVHQGDLIQ